MEESISKLRTDIEIIPAHLQGEKGLIIKDSLGLIQKPVLIRGENLLFLGLIDGKRNIRDIQLELIRRKGGLFVSSEEVQRVVSELDSVFLLDSERYRQERARIISEYSLLEVRETFLAGRSYPGSAAELKAYLASFFQGEKESYPELNGKKINALVAPHIDLEVGKKVYTKAYRAIEESSPQKIVLLGTGHNLQEYFFSLTEKDFETPLGRVKTEKEWVRKLKDAGKKVISPNDIAHRTEHSLEFQVLFLQYLFEGNFSLIPILCGSFNEVLNSVSRPSEIPGMDDFLQLLRHFMEKASSDTLIVTGVDFSHIGPKFGHPQRASSMLLEAKNHDKILIDSVCRGDIESFWSEMKRVHNRYNVCGFSSLAVLMELLPGAKGHLFGYDFWEEEPTQSAVSFAAIALDKV